MADTLKEALEEIDKWLSLDGVMSQERRRWLHAIADAALSAPPAQLEPTPLYEVRHGMWRARAYERQVMPTETGTITPSGLAVTPPGVDSGSGLTQEGITADGELLPTKETVLAYIQRKQQERDTANALLRRAQEALEWIDKSGAIGGHDHPRDLCKCGNCMVRRLSAAITAHLKP